MGEGLKNSDLNLDREDGVAVLQNRLDRL